MKQAAQHIHPDYVNLVYAFKGSPPKCFRNLSAAILNQALDDLHKKNPQNRLSAEYWIFADDTGYIFSFLNICSGLNLDPELIRKNYRKRLV